MLNVMHAIQLKTHYKPLRKSSYDLNIGFQIQNEFYSHNSDRFLRLIDMTRFDLHSSSRHPVTNIQQS